MIKKDDVVGVGKLLKTHALKGEVNLLLDIDPLYLEQGNPLLIEIDGIIIPFYAASIRPKGTFSYIVKLEGVDSEKEASQFVNKEVFILKKDLPEWSNEELEEEHDLIGYIVKDLDSDQNIGEIIEIDDNTSNIILIIRSEDGEEIYIPYSEDFIEGLDDERKTISMNLPEGLLDINKKTKKEEE